MIYQQDNISIPIENKLLVSLLLNRE